MQFFKNLTKIIFNEKMILKNKKFPKNTQEHKNDIFQENLTKNKNCGLMKNINYDYEWKNSVQSNGARRDECGD